MIFAIPAAAAASPQKPRIAAMIATIRNPRAQRSIVTSPGSLHIRKVRHPFLFSGFACWLLHPAKIVWHSGGTHGSSAFLHRMRTLARPYPLFLRRHLRAFMEGIFFVWRSNELGPDRGSVEAGVRQNAREMGQTNRRRFAIRRGPSRSADWQIAGALWYRSRRGGTRSRRFQRQLSPR